MQFIVTLNVFCLHLLVCVCVASCGVVDGMRSTVKGMAWIQCLKNVLVGFCVRALDTQYKDRCFCSQVVIYSKLLRQIMHMRLPLHHGASQHDSCLYHPVLCGCLVPEHT